MLIRKLIRFRYYRKIVLSFILIGILLITVAIICVTVIFSNTTLDKVGGVSVNAISQVSLNVSSILNECRNASNELLTEKYFYSTLSGKKLDRLKEYELLQALKTIKVGYSGIKNIGIVNAGLDRYVGTRGIYFGVEEEIDNAVYSDHKIETTFKRSVKSYENFPESPEIQMLTYLYQPYIRGENEKSCIVIDVELSTIIAQLQKSEDNIWKNIVILDEKGKVLTSSIENKAVSQKAINKIESQMGVEDSGYFITKKSTNSERQLVSFSKVDEMPWYIMGIQSYQSIYSSYGNIQNVFILGAIMVIIIYFFASIFLSNYIYSPINSILQSMDIKNEKENKQDELILLGNEFHVYKQRADTYSWNHSKLSRLLRRVLLNQNYIFTNDDNNCLVESVFQQEDFPCRIAIVSLDYQSKSSNLANDRNLYLYILNKLLTELLVENKIKCSGFSIDDHGELEFVILFMMQGNKSMSNIKIAMSEMQLILKKEFDLFVSMGLGKQVLHLNEIKKSYQTAKECLYHRILEGDMTFSVFEEFKEVQTDEKYPSILERKLGEALFYENDEALWKTFEKFCSILEEISANQVIQFSQRLCLSLLTRSFPLLDTSNTDIAVFTNLSDQISKAQNLSDIITVLKKFIQEIQQMGSVNFELNHNNTERTIQTVKELIIQKYADPNLSVASISDCVGLSATYLGQMFLKHMEMSCNDYISMVRMERAAQQLTESSLTIQQISQNVGIINTNYFYTLFKKTYGITPNKYRASNRESK